MIVRMYISAVCTQWFNSDDCEGDRGDWEVIHNDDGISSSVIECPLSYLIQGKINNTILNSPKDAYEATGNHVRFYYPLIGLTGAGLICDNRNHTDYNKGPKQQCENYSVRFCCPGGRLLFQFEYIKLTHLIVFGLTHIHY